MRQSVILHLVGEEPVIGEIDDMPNKAEQFMILHHPRRRDGKPLGYVNDDVTAVIFPWHRINLVQILPVADIEDVIGFVRE